MLLARRLYFTRSISNIAESALYITGDKAHNNFAVLTPHLDIEDRFANRVELEANISARRLRTINLEKIEQRWLFYLHLLDRKSILGYTKSEIGKEISKLMKEENKNEEELQKFQEHQKVIKDEYSVLKNYMYGVEESAALHALSLPNYLHKLTPIEQPEILFSFNEQPTHLSESHVEIGAEKNLLTFVDNSVVFLTQEAALFEQAIVNYFQEKLVNSDFIQFSNADFCKSVVAEGCDTDFINENLLITINEDNKHSVNRLHLTGGASYYSFMAFFTKYKVNAGQLPLKMFSQGRKYVKDKTNSPLTLFNLSQQSATEVMIATENSGEELDEHFNSLTEKIKEIYNALNIHYRLVLLPAHKIRKFESLRLSIEMYSNFLKEYVEVGNVSICDDYLSKRLLFNYVENKDFKFPKIIFSNILNVHKMLGCIIENSQEKGLLADELKKYAPL